MSDAKVQEKTVGEKLPTPAQKASARLAAVQALYLYDYGQHKVDAIVRDFLGRLMPVESDAPPADFDAGLFAEIVQGAASRLSDIDAMLAASLDPKWPLERIERILKALLRAGVAELMRSGTDAAIIINDYVNVAHGFFAGKEPAMANAILDKLAKTLRQ